MLDRLPTELVTVILEATSATIWQRKATLDRLGVVCKRFRIAVQPLANRIVHVPNPKAISILRSWPATKRRLIDTVLVGTDDQSENSIPFDYRDLTRLFANLPAAKNVFFRQLQVHPAVSTAIGFGLVDSYPVKNCHSLSVRQSELKFEPTLERILFHLRHLRLDLGHVPAAVPPGYARPGPEQIMPKHLPFLQSLRFSSPGVFDPSHELLEQLKVAQIDLTPRGIINMNFDRLRELASLSTPVLFSFGAGFPLPGPSGLAAAAIKYSHLEAQSDVLISSLIKNLPNLKALSIKNRLNRTTTTNPDPLAYPGLPSTMDEVNRRSIALFGGGGNTDDGGDFIDTGFTDYLWSTGAL
ncbi:hypothetical protein JCM10908_004711 [Rhodotorula pacifica]|uniref:uncharacterized protein n=1 Tax=Rhodotorula pacifica TaxID=1495444 RepID=UPI003174639B